MNESPYNTLENLVILLSWYLYTPRLDKNNHKIVYVDSFLIEKQN
jgi:hypothetical protein